MISTTFYKRIAPHSILTNETTPLNFKLNERLAYSSRVGGVLYMQLSKQPIYQTGATNMPSYNYRERDIELTMYFSVTRTEEEQRLKGDFLPIKPRTSAHHEYNDAIKKEADKRLAIAASKGTASISEVLAKIKQTHRLTIYQLNKYGRYIKTEQCHDDLRKLNIKDVQAIYSNANVKITLRNQSRRHT